MNYASNAGAQKSQRSNGQPEAFSTGETILTLIYSAVVQRLTCALSIAKWQQYTGCRKKFGNKPCRRVGEGEVPPCMQAVTPDMIAGAVTALLAD